MVPSQNISSPLPQKYNIYDYKYSYFYIETEWNWIIRIFHIDHKLKAIIHIVSTSMCDAVLYIPICHNKESLNFSVL